MNKYDFQLDLYSKNSPSIIVRFIEGGSRVLEFGPATGRLTKYLKEDKNCVVDIVEINEEDGLNAKKHANISFIGEHEGDIEKYVWFNSIQGILYDYIIFADVLEHLKNPDLVLKKCNKILKDNGSILISVPNTAHNSIIINLINDEFRYTNVGLLDNTHLRFFTYKSLKRLINQAGYETVNEKYVYSRVGENEIDCSYSDLDKNIAKFIRLREKGNIYQYVFEIKKAEFFLTANSDKIISLDENSGYEFRAYYKSRNNDYSEKHTFSKLYNPSNIINTIKIPIDSITQEVRIDPLACNCIISVDDLFFLDGNERVSLDYNHNGIEISDKLYIFNHDDPQILINIDDLKIEYILIDFQVIDYDNDNISFYNELIMKKMENIEEQSKCIQQLIQEKDAIIQEKDAIIQEKDAIIQKYNNFKIFKIVNKLKG